MKAREWGVALGWGLCLSAMILVGIRFDSSFGFPAAGIFIAGALANSIFTGVVTTAFSFFFLLVLLTVGSFVWTIPSRAFDVAFLCLLGACLISRWSDRHVWLCDSRDIHN